MVAESTYMTLQMGDFTDYTVTPDNDEYHGSDGKERLVAFLTDLSKLTQKYGFIIGGCGCCGSPYITDIKCDDNDYGCDNLTYNPDTQSYNASDDYGNPIIYEYLY